MKYSCGFHNHIVACTLGVSPQERAHVQNIAVDLRYSYDITAVLATSSLTDGIDYTQVAEYVEEVLQKEDFELLETACAIMVQKVCERFPPIQELFLRITKIEQSGFFAQIHWQGT